MKAIRFFILFCFLLSVAAKPSFAQNTPTTPLKDYLLVLQERFDVVFTYADENIEGISVTLARDKKKLDECLAELEQQTNLDFRKLDSRYIAIHQQMSRPVISGILIDQNTREPVEGAVIFSKYNHTISHRDGFFSLPVNPEDSVAIVRYTGYEPLHIRRQAWTGDSAVYRLIPDVQELQEIVVDYVAKGIDKLPDGALKMNIQNIEVLPGLSEPDVLHTIQVLPGVQSVNETVAHINIRGGTNDQSLVLWDGVKMYQTGHFFGLISAFNSSLIQQTHIAKNGADVSVGEGISGIVDMRQQDALVKAFSLSTGVNMISADMIMKVPATEKLSFILGARHSINNFVITPTYKSYYRRAFEDSDVLINEQQADDRSDVYHDFGFYDLSFKLLYDLSEKDQVRLSVLNIDNSIDYEENAMLGDTLYRQESQLSQSSILSNLNYTHSWNSNHSIKFSAYASYYNLEGRNAALVSNATHNQENEVTDLGAGINSRNRLSPSIELSSGYQFEEVGIRNLDNLRNPGYFREAKGVLRIHSVYSGTELKGLIDRLYLKAGLRSSYITKFEDFSFEPAIAANYKLSKSFSIEAMANRKMQHSTQLVDFQDDFLGVEKRRWVLSNEQTVPRLTSRQFSLGLQYNRHRLLVALEGYTKEVDGIITFSQGFQNQYQWVYSIGKYDTHGLELLVNKQYRYATVWMNYTLAQNDYHFPDLSPSTFPNNLDIRHTVSLGGIVTYKQFELSGGMNYRTGKPYTQPSQDEPTEGRIVYGAPNSARLGEYVRFDVSGNYCFSLNKMKGQLGFSVWNILNRHNVINRYYRINERNEIEQVTQYALGFTPNVNFRLEF